MGREEARVLRYANEIYRLMKGNVNGVLQCFAACKELSFACRACGTGQVLGAGRRACVARR